MLGEFQVEVSTSFVLKCFIFYCRMLTTKKALLFVGHMDTPFSSMKYTKALREYHNKIIECKFENNNWVFMHERTDKSYPNAYNTAKGW